MLTVNIGFISSVHFATKVISHVIAVLKSKSFPFNVHPPNVYHVLVGSDGLVAFDPYAILCVTGVGVHQLELNVTL